MYEVVLPFLNTRLFVITRYHGGGVCPTRTSGRVYEKTADSTLHAMEVPGGQAAGVSSQLFGKRGKHKQIGSTQIRVDRLSLLTVDLFYMCVCVCVGGQKAGPWLCVRQKHPAGQRRTGCR